MIVIGIISTRETKQKITFIFRVLSYIAVAAFLLSLRHKMIGLELITSCQVAYFSYALYSQPTFISSSLTHLKMVTGYRSLYYEEKTDGEMFYPFCETT